MTTNLIINLRPGKSDRKSPKSWKMAPFLPTGILDRKPQKIPENEIASPLMEFSMESKACLIGRFTPRNPRSLRGFPFAHIIIYRTSAPDPNPRREPRNFSQKDSCGRKTGHFPRLRGFSIGRGGSPLYRGERGVRTSPLRRKGSPRKSSIFPAAVGAPRGAR